MRLFFEKIHLSRALLQLLALLSVIGFCGCEPMMESEGDCEPAYFVKFRFKMNILDVDAFSSKVRSVSLFVFDRQGNCVAVQREAGQTLADADYKMPLDLPAGTYDLIAWCGMQDNEDFALDNGVAPVRREDLVCRLLTVTPASSGDTGEALTPIWHGRVDNVVLEAGIEGEKVVATVDLIKDVNTVRIVLQHWQGRALDPDDFGFEITDDNGIMNWDNSLMPCEMLTYRPFSKHAASVAMPDADAESGEKTSVSSLLAEIDIARLVSEGGHKSAVLTVTRSGQEKPVLRLPLTELLLMVKGEVRKDMDDQEYLDRQDEYDLIFFLDDAGWYINGGIWVNSWHIRDFSFNM